MAIDRTIKVGEEMKKEISNIIQNELKDPRIKGIISVTKVDVTKDMRYAKVYISIYNQDDSKQEVLEGIKSSAGFIRKEVGKRIKVHYTPELIFELDNSIEYGMKINDILNNLNKK